MEYQNIDMENVNIIYKFLKLLCYLKKFVINLFILQKIQESFL